MTCRDACTWRVSPPKGGPCVLFQTSINRPSAKRAAEQGEFGARKRVRLRRAPGAAIARERLVQAAELGANDHPDPTVAKLRGRGLNRPGVAVAPSRGHRQFRRVSVPRAPAVVRIARLGHVLARLAVEVIEVQRQQQPPARKLRESQQRTGVFAAVVHAVRRFPCGAAVARRDVVDVASATRRDPGARCPWAT